MKSFAQHIIDDHQKVQEELKQVAGNKGTDTPQKIDPKQQATQKKLERLKGESFDQAYVAAMVKDHKQDVKEYKQQAQSSDDPKIKDWAAQTVPKLQQHLQMAESLQAQLQQDEKSSKN